MESESAAEYRKGKEVTGGSEGNQADGKASGTWKEESKRSGEPEETTVRCLTVSESESGEGTRRCKRQSGPERYEAERKQSGERSANRESRGKPEMEESTRRAKSEPRAWGGARARKQAGHKRKLVLSTRSAVSKGSESGTESKVVG